MIQIHKTQKTAIQEFANSDPEAMKLFQQERAILEATELICEIMEADGVSRSELAKRLGKTKGYVTQLLDGQTNMTLKTMSNVFLALGRTFHMQEGPLAQTVVATEPLSRSINCTVMNHPYKTMLEPPTKYMPGKGLAA